MSAAELEAKFYNLSVPRLGEERSQQAWSEMGRLEQSGNLDVLVQMLAPGERDRE
jgi:hypothetical protein